MIVDKEISLMEVDRELAANMEFLEKLGIKISKIDREKLLFSVQISSSSDKEEFELDIQFDNYPAWPPLIEFIHPKTRERGIVKAYPKTIDSFFHGFPCICNPCSRKSYKSFDGNAPHGDWNYIGWRDNPQVGTLKTIPAILFAINSRITNSNFYRGRLGT
jgi:hypothetical protein